MSDGPAQPGAAPRDSPPPAAPRRDQPPLAPAGRSPHAWLTLGLTTVVGLVLDLVSKYAAFRWVAPSPQAVDRVDVLRILSDDPTRLMALIDRHEPLVIIPGLLRFQLVLNAGAVFGTGQGKRWFFIGFTAVALAFALWLFARWTEARDRWAHLSIGLIIAGGIGNLYDRLTYACVRDFIHPLPGWQLPFGLAWPSGDRDVWPYVSNVADALLLVGIGLLMIKLWRAEPRPAQAETD